LAYSLLVIFASCENFAKNIKDKVDRGVEEASKKMDAELITTKLEFRNRYKNAKINITEAVKSSLLDSLFHTVTATSAYLDSLRGIINKLDPDDLNNVDTIKEIFLARGIGDSLFNKLSGAYDLAMEVSLNVATKDGISENRDNSLINQDATRFKTTFFGVNNPLGAGIILYSLETDLLNAGAQSLEN